MRLNKKLIYKFAAASILPAIVSIVGITVAAMPSPDAVLSFNQLNFSTRASTPNLIEVFTDGFDYELAASDVAAEARGLFKDFYDFKYTYGHYGSTSLSKSLGLGGFVNYNAAAIYERSAPGTDWTTTYFNNEMNNALVKHLNVAQSYFSERALIGLVDIMALGSSRTVWAGDANYARDFLPSDVRLMNWAGARNTVASAVGVTNLSLEALYTHAFDSVAAVDNNNARGTRIFLQNNISHAPRKAAEDGSNRFDITVAQSISAGVADLKHLIKAMQSKTDINGRSIYDNSMFVFWGDHADHSQWNYPLSNSMAYKDHTRLMIKWPNVTKDELTIYDSALVSLGQINYIIHDYFVNRRDDPLALFTTSPFALTRELPFVGNTDQGFGLMWGRLQNGLMQPSSELIAINDPSVRSDLLSLRAVAGVDV